MKAIKLILSIASLITIVTLFNSCKGSDPTEADRVQALLTSAEWKLSNFTMDNVSMNTYDGLKLSFNNGGFTSVNGRGVWPATGTWSFTDDSGKSFKRGDEALVDIISISETNLTLSLDWANTTVGPGRSSSVPGKHVFSMTK